jgi:tRNA(adenine34) deaminase
MNDILAKTQDHDYFMAKALKLAKKAKEEGEVPVGCLIVKDKKIIAQAYNQVEKLNDSTAHAEMIAITQAEAFLKSKWLKGCSLYVTIEPCFMCACALVLCRIDKVFFATPEPRSGAFGSVADINRLGLNHRIKVSSGIRSQESAALIQGFFFAKRQIRT